MFESEQAPSVDEEPRLPLVMIHGFGCGIPQFYKNFDHLHSNRKLYAIDLPGFARSTRVTFTPDAETCEQEFVDYIEKWREGVGLEKFILLGHSLGAFLSCAYTIRHPNRVRHLILDDPWGFPLKPAQIAIGRKRPLLYKAVTLYTKRFNPLSPIRFAGPLGMYIDHQLCFHWVFNSASYFYLKSRTIFDESNKARPGRTVWIRFHELCVPYYCSESFVSSGFHSCNYCNIISLCLFYQ